MKLTEEGTAMKLTFPQLGDAHLLGRLFFREIGVEMISPLPNTQTGLARGSALSPEEMCLPFKLMMDNLVSAWEQGADTVLMPATMGPCRLGEYAELMKTLLDAEGMTYRWILLDSPQAIGRKELLHRFRCLIDPGGKSKVFVLRRLIRLYRLNHRLEDFSAAAALGCGWERENSRGNVKALAVMCRRELSQADSLSQGLRLVKKYQISLKEEVRCQKRAWRRESEKRSVWQREAVGEKLERQESEKRGSRGTETEEISSKGRNRRKGAVSRKLDRPLRILLTGEIYSGIEPFANHRIEELLMELGVSFEKPVTMGWWLGRNLKSPLRLWKSVWRSKIAGNGSRKDLGKEKNGRGTKGIPYEIGGYAKDTVEESLRSADRGFDGVIQILPAGCMPEIVAKSVLSGISRDRGLKCLTLIFDEGAGDAGYVTRVEAFVDLLWRSRQQKAKSGQNQSVRPIRAIQPIRAATPMEAPSAAVTTEKRRGKHVLFGN